MEWKNPSDLVEARTFSALKEVCLFVQQQSQKSSGLSMQSYQKAGFGYASMKPVKKGHQGTKDCHSTRQKLAETPLPATAAINMHLMSSATLLLSTVKRHVLRYSAAQDTPPVFCQEGERNWLSKPQREATKLTLHKSIWRLPRD